jgi:hypothetical protein
MLRECLACVRYSYNSITVTAFVLVASMKPCFKGPFWCRFRVAPDSCVCSKKELTLVHSPKKIGSHEAL